jgi:cation:H+ antiporter
MILDVAKNLVLLVLGFVLLVKGADWFVEGASKLAEKFGIPQIVIGLTIVAMGTSLPEAAVSIASAAKGSADIAIGNVLGSNIMNVLLILGLTALFCEIPVKPQTVKFEIPFMIAMTVLLFVVGYFDGNVGRPEGAMLWACFIGYLLYLRRRAKAGDELEEAPGADKQIPLWQMILFIFLGAGMIVLGSDLAVDGASGLARLMGVSERVIGLTVVAFGTSLPELVTSVTAARKQKTDIAIGNIVGSNIFNILFVIGTTGLITPVIYQQSFLEDSIVAIATALLLLVLVLPKKRLTRIGGALMLVAYAAYFVMLLL